MNSRNTLGPVRLQARLAWIMLVAVCPSVAQTSEPATLQQVVQNVYTNCTGTSTLVPGQTVTSTVPSNASSTAPFKTTFTATASCDGTTVTVNTSISVSPIDVNATNTGTTVTGPNAPATQTGTYPVWGLSPAVAITAQSTVSFTGGSILAAEAQFLAGATITPGVTGTCPASADQTIGNGNSIIPSGTLPSVSQTCTWQQTYQYGSASGVLAPDTFLQTQWFLNGGFSFTVGVDLSSQFALAAASTCPGSNARSGSRGARASA